MKDLLDLLNDLADWIPILILGVITAMAVVLGAATAIEQIVVYIQQMIG